MSIFNNLKVKVVDFRFYFCYNTSIMKDTIYKAKVSPQGQITLPKKLRQQAKLVDGQSIYISLQSPSMVSVQTEPPIAAFYGILKPKPSEPSMSDTITEIREIQKQKMLR